MVVKTKFYMPSPSTATILRDRLLQPLRDHLGLRLQIIVAGPGFGKTTLLSQLMQGIGCPAVYCSLDSGDGEGNALLDCLVTAVEHLGRQAADGHSALGAKSRQMLALTGTARDHRPVVSTLINELADQCHMPGVIILDDCHELPAGCNAWEVLDYFIGRLPPNIHLLLASRIVPPLPSLHKWRARRELFELTQAELQFTRDELASFARLSVVRRFVDEDIDHLYRSTDGWIAGIILMLLSPQPSGPVRHSLRAATTYVFDYFASEILDREPPEIQRFLIQSSILPLVTPAAAAAVTGADVTGRLKELVGRIPFIERAGDDGYRYHNLFRQFLQSRLGGPEQQRELYRRAASHYQAAGDPGSAIDCLLAADDAGAAAALVDKLSFSQLYLLPFRRWLAQIPESLWPSHPRLYRMQAELLANEGKIAEHFACLERRLAVAKRSGTRRDLCNAWFDLGLAQIHHGDAAIALRHLRQALRTCPGADRLQRALILEQLSAAMRLRGDLRAAGQHLRQSLWLIRRFGDADTLANVENSLAILTGQAGDYAEALRIYQRLFSRFGGRYSFEVGAIYSSAAYYAIHAGRLETARRWLEDGLRVCEPYADNRSRDRLYYALGHLHLHQGSWALAERYFLMCIDHHRQTGYRSDPSQMVELCDLAYLGHCRGDREYAQQYLQQCEARGVPAGGRFSFQRAMVLVQLGRRVEADRIGVGMSRSRDSLKAFYGCLILAASEHGGAETALRHLRRADQLAVRHGYDGILGLELRSWQPLARLARRSIGARRLHKLMPEQPASEAVGPDVLRINLLGPFEIRTADGRILPVRWRTKKSLSLLAYLIVSRNRCCGSEELMELLWPGTSPRQASNRLYVTIAQTKQGLSKGFRTTGARRPWASLIRRCSGGYTIEPSLPLVTDIELLERRWQGVKALGIAADNAPDIEACLALYRGDFLSNVDDSWCLELRSRYSRIHRQVAEALADYYAGQRLFEQAARLYRVSLNHDPFNEQTHIKLWRVLSETECRGEIVADFEELKKVLRQQLQTRPSPLTEREFRALSSATA